MGFFSIESRQLLRSIEPKFFALYLLDRCSIHWALRFAIDRSSTAPRQIHFCQDLVLNRSIELRFLYIAKARFQFHFSHSLLTQNTFSLSNLSTHVIFGLDQALTSWYVFLIPSFSCIHAFLDLGFGFLKIFGVFEVFTKCFGCVLLI